MHDPFFLLWLTSTMILVPPAWAATVVVFLLCFRVNRKEQQSTTKSLTETQTRVVQTRVLLLSRPILETSLSSICVETHIIAVIERLSNVALHWKSPICWMMRVLGLQNPSDHRQTIDVTPREGRVQILGGKRMDDKRYAS